MVDLDDSPVTGAQAPPTTPVTSRVADPEPPALNTGEAAFRAMLMQPLVLPVVRHTRDRLRLTEIGKTR